MKQVQKGCRAVRAPQHPQHPNTRQVPANPARYPTAALLPKKAFAGESLKNELDRKWEKNLKFFAP